MLTKSILLETNPQLGLLNEVFQDTRNLFRDSTLSNSAQIAAAEVFLSCADNSLFSVEIDAHTGIKELAAEISSDRYNFMQILNLEGINYALDLSEDLGGIAHFLADQVVAVDSVKVDLNRARLSKLRCADRPNICHVSEDLDQLVLPDRHYDLIVLGNYEALNIARDSQAQFLSRLQASLTPGGVLILNVKNRQRISKWLSPTQSNKNGLIPYGELYDTDFELEFEHKKLLTVLADSNYSAIDFSGSFSVGERYQNLFSEDYLTANPDALNHFYRLGAFNNEEISEYLLIKNLFETQKRVFDLASRYLVVAGSSGIHTRRVINTDFAHFAGGGRKLHWRTVTYRHRAAPEVLKRPIYPATTSDDADKNPDAHQLVKQQLAPQPFHRGRLLIGDWLEAILVNDWSAFGELVEQYYAWAQQLASEENFSETAYDLLPFNLIVNEKAGAQQYRIIDPEWQIDAEFGADFLLFRALFYFAFENRAALRGYAHYHDLASIAMFVVQYLPGVDQIHELRDYTKLEERIQAEISDNFHTKSVEHALLQSFERPPLIMDLDPKCQVLWGNESGVMDNANRVIVVWPETPVGEQVIRIDLPVYAPQKPILRIDPVISKGVFHFDRIKILDHQKDSIYYLTSASSICEAAEVQNAEVLPTADNQTIFIASAEGPHFLFDLGQVPNIEQARHLELSLTLVNDANHDLALTALTKTINEQNIALVQQVDHLNQYRSDKAHLKVLLSDLVEHRRFLSKQLNEKTTELAKQENDFERKFAHLTDRLEEQQNQFAAQVERNARLEQFLLTRPTARFKNFVRRRLGKPTEIVEPVNPKAELPDNAFEVGDEVEVDPNVLPSEGELLGQNTEDYQKWIAQHTLSDSDIEQAKNEIEKFEYKPLFSILVPVYNTDLEFLIPMIRSVQAQIYPYWQLCLVDDASPKNYLKRILEYEASQDDRISIQLNERNQGISLATNDALRLAKGDYVGLLDHDDELSIDALFENAKVINQYRDVGLIYSDEDKMDMEGERLEPFFKPDYSPDLLDTNNYVCHFTVMDKSIVEEIGGFREGLEGSQDHDIILRAIELSKRVVHIPKILYHWRKIPGSTAVAYDSKSYAWEAGRKAIENRLQKTERGARVEFGSLKGTYRIFRKIHGEPLVSIIIPFKDKPELLESCLNSILDRSTYKNFEIVGISNNSEESETFARMEHFKQADPRISFVEKNIPFNFSALCNYGVQQAKGEYILLLNNDIEIQSPDWIERLLEHAQRPEVGAVGGKLLYPDGRIQHAGVVAGMVGAAGHPHKFFPDNHIGYHGRLHMVFNVSAVTGAMMMVNTQKYHEVGGLDEENLAVAYNDIDLCLKLLDAGYLNVFTPHCRAIHHESISRGYEDTDEKLARLKREQSHFLGKWQEFLAAGDPYYNRNLSLENERFSLNFKD